MSTADGGVVQAAFSFQPNVPGRLHGRWRIDAYEPFSLGWSAQGFRLDLVPTQPDHPILAGVVTFNGGGSSYHHVVQPQGCAELIARWSNGQPLVVARIGPHGGRIVGLNFYPASSDAFNTGYWDSKTDGATLMANALRFAALPALPPSGNGPAVALLAADEPTLANDLRCKLEQTALFSRVDLIDGRSTTPSLSSLSPYDAVLEWSNNGFGDSAALGNVLAAYVNQDRGVVQAIGRLDGEWEVGGYQPLTDGPVGEAAGLTLLSDAADHPVLMGVIDFNGGLRSYHEAPVYLDRATTRIASWSNGQPLVAVGTGPSRGRVVGLNLYPPSSDARADLWDSSTDGARLIANTLVFAANHAPFADAGLDQSIEATSPAGASFAVNATASDVDGDILTFQWSGAATGTGQNVIVDLPPPVAPSQSHTYVLTLTVGDGKGAFATDSVNLIVTDTIGPVLQNMPSGVISATATSPSGADVVYGPVTAIDAVDGDRPVTCSPSGPFPVGDTVVTCSSSDTRSNNTTASFTVRVTAGPVPKSGRAAGHGFVRRDGLRYEFTFEASENPSTGERAELFLGVRANSGALAGRPSQWDVHFAAKTVDAVTFDVWTVHFSGVGQWNGQAGYRYDASAVDSPDGHDRMRIRITSPDGAQVVWLDEELGGGNVRVVLHP